MKKQKSLTEQDRKLAEEIFDKELDFLTIQKSIKDSRFTREGMPVNYSPYDVRAGARIMYDAMYGRIIEAMQAYHEAKMKEKLIEFPIMDYDIMKQGPCGSFCIKYWLGDGCDDDCTNGLHKKTRI